MRMPCNISFYGLVMTVTIHVQKSVDCCFNKGTFSGKLGCASGWKIMKNTHKIMVAGFGIVLSLLVAIAVNMYQSEQRDKAQQNHLILDEGIALYDQGKYLEALHKLETIEFEVTQDWQVPYYKGAASVRLKDYPAAATYLEQANSLNSSNTQTLYLLGVVYFKLGNLKLSEGYFTATLELDPTHDEARGLMGVLSDLKKRQEKPTQPEKP
jgi:tetratricopeptide (TPR) repeat protein